MQSKSGITHQPPGNWRLGLLIAVCLGSLLLAIEFIRIQFNWNQGLSHLTLKPVILIFIGLGMGFISRPVLSRSLSGVALGVLVMTGTGFLWPSTDQFEFLLRPFSQHMQADAFSLSFLAGAVLLSAGQKRSLLVSIAGIASLTAAVFGLLAMLRLLSFQGGDTYWSGLLSTPHLLAVGVSTLGLGFAFHLWNNASSRVAKWPLWQSGQIFMCGFVLANIFYQAEMNSKIQHLRDISESSANHVRDILLQQIETRGKALERMAHRWAANDGFEPDVWYKDATQHLTDLPGCEALGKTDPAGKFEVLKSDSVLPFSHTSEVTEVSEMVDRIRATGRPIVEFQKSRTFPYLDNETAFALASPIYTDSGDYLGLILAVFKSKEFFSAIAGSEILLPNFNIELREESTVLFSRGDKSSFLNTPFLSSQRSLSRVGENWTLVVSPTQEFVTQTQASLAAQILFGGICVSLITAILFFLARLAILQSRDSVKLSNKLQAILDGSTRVSIIATDRDGLVTLFNSGAEHMLGYKASEVVGKESVLKFHKSTEIVERGKRMIPDAEKLQPFEILTFEAHSGDYQEHTWSFIKKNGKKVPANVIMTPIREGQEIKGFVEIAVDVTRTERQFRNYARRLEMSNKELEEFSYVASHDLKEPIRNLISYSKLLEEDVGEDLSQDAKDDLMYITDAARRMETLVNDLLHLSRAGRNAMKFVDISLHEIIELAKQNLDVRIQETQASFHVQRDLPAVYVDKTMFCQLFSNLISNALKFVTPGVRPEITISCKSDRTGYTISVADNGIGMKTEYLDRIFKPFKRLHGMSKFEGTGIGLSICRKIVRRHEGDLTVESELGTGSTFHIRINHRKEEGI